jgi:zinc protease
VLAGGVALVALVADTALSAQQTDGKAPASLTKLAAPQVDVPRLKYTRFVMPNGLVVILHEDHSAPVVAVNLTYHVGSMDEPVGKRGLAHLFEHTMFGGSAHVAAGEHSRILQEVGGKPNGQTSNDKTVYTEEVPPNMLATALWLEAERMAFLPASLDSQRFELQRSEVINEYGLRFEASPAADDLAAESLLESLFPDPHPYHTGPIGIMAELKAATLDDVRAFFAKYYVPNNATLVLAGDFETADARKTVERYFGGLPGGAVVTHPMVPQTPLAGESRVVLEDRVANTQQLWIGWRGAPSKSKDRIALVALSAILTRGPTSRLWQALVTQHRLATPLPPINGSYDLAGVGIFQIVASPLGSASMTDIERVTDSVVADVRDHGVRTEELRRWLAAFTVNSVTRLQKASVRADLLGDGDVVYGDPGAELNDIDAARLLTPADIQRVARQYLVPGRVVMSIVPAGKVELRSKPDAPYRNVTPVKP